jgi:hypothetical protein
MVVGDGEVGVVPWAYSTQPSQYFFIFIFLENALFSIT